MFKNRYSQLALVIIGLLAAALVYTGVSAGHGIETENLTDIDATTQINLPVILDVPLQQLPLRNGGFEEGPVHWTQSTTSGFPIVTPANDLVVDPRSGSWAAWLGGADDDVSLLAQDVTITLDKDVLVMWHWMASLDICGPDVARIIVNTTTVWSRELCDAKETNGWERMTVNLSSYAGQVVKLQFRTETDGSLNSNWFLDDLSLQSNAQALAGDGSGPVDGLMIELDQASNTK